MLHDVEQGAGNPRSRATERVTQRNRAAVQVNLLIHLVEHFQVLEYRQGLRGERFVELDEVDVARMIALMSMARWPDMTIMHEAPSVICDEVPAVTVPLSG